MKVVVTMNEDGHFSASLTSERENCIYILKRIFDGEFFEDRYEDALDAVGDVCTNYDDLFDCPLERFEEFLYQFEQRGTFEIVIVEL